MNGIGDEETMKVKILRHFKPNEIAANKADDEVRGRVSGGIYWVMMRGPAWGNIKRSLYEERRWVQ